MDTFKLNLLRRIFRKSKSLLDLTEDIEVSYGAVLEQMNLKTDLKKELDSKWNDQIVRYFKKHELDPSEEHLSFLNSVLDTIDQIVSDSDRRTDFNDKIDAKGIQTSFVYN